MTIAWSAPAAGPAVISPLRSHLLILVVGTLLPVLIVAGLLIRRVVADNRTSIENSLIATAHAQAAIVDRELTGTIRALFVKPASVATLIQAINELVIGLVLRLIPGAPGRIRRCSRPPAPARSRRGDSGSRHRRVPRRRSSIPCVS